MRFEAKEVIKTSIIGVVVMLVVLVVIAVSFLLTASFAQDGMDRSVTTAFVATIAWFAFVGWRDTKWKDHGDAGGGILFFGATWLFLALVGITGAQGVHYDGIRSYLALVAVLVLTIGGTFLGARVVYNIVDDLRDDYSAWRRASYYRAQLEANSKE